RKAADGGVVPLLLGDDLLTRGAKRREHCVEVVHAQIDHILAVGGEIVTFGLEGLEDERAGGDVPDPFVGRRAVVCAAAPADAESLLIPGFERRGIPRAEAKSADTFYMSHRTPPRDRARRLGGLPQRIHSPLPLNSSR